MKTNPRSTTRSLVLAALFLALAFVLPMITGHVPQVGSRFGQVDRADRTQQIFVNFLRLV